MIRTLFVVSANLPNGLPPAPPTRGEAPQKDFAAIGQRLDADLLDWSAARRTLVLRLLCAVLGIATILEAMAMGKPVIATHTYGQTDVIEDRRSVTRGAQERARPISLLRNVADEEDVPIEPNGFYVPPKDPEALQRAIVFLLDHPEERKRLGEAGRRAVERLMSVDQFADRIARVVDIVVRTKGRASVVAKTAQTSNTGAS